MVEDLLDCVLCVYMFHSSVYYVDKYIPIFLATVGSTTPLRPDLRAWGQNLKDKEQPDSNYRGGRRAIMGRSGKGPQRTCVKDQWTKPKGGRSKGGRCW